MGEHSARPLRDTHGAGAALSSLPRGSAGVGVPGRTACTAERLPRCHVATPRTEKAIAEHARPAAGSAWRFGLGPRNYAAGRRLSDKLDRRAFAHGVAKRGGIPVREPHATMGCRLADQVGIRGSVNSDA